MSFYYRLLRFQNFCVGVRITGFNDSSGCGLGSGQAAETLAELPQLLGSGVVSGLRLDARHWRALCEIVSAERLDALLQGTVERGLSSRLGIHEKKEDNGRHDQPPPETGVTSDFCFNGSWTEKPGGLGSCDITVPFCSRLFKHLFMLVRTPSLA